MSDINENTTPQQPAPLPPRMSNTKLFVVARINDSRVQFLAPSDPDDDDSEVDWSDLSAFTRVWDDREDAFQAARANQGLIVSATGIPGAANLRVFSDRLRARRQEMYINEEAKRTANEDRNASTMKAAADKKNRRFKPTPADDEVPY